MAIAVNLFPTNYRGMATAFIMMCGRIGGVTGSSVIGIMLNINCAIIFYFFSGIIISKCLVLDLYDSISTIKPPNNFIVLGCAFVFMMVRIKPQ